MNNLNEGSLIQQEPRSGAMSLAELAKRMNKRAEEVRNIPKLPPEQQELERAKIHDAWKRAGIMKKNGELAEWASK